MRLEIERGEQTISGLVAVEGAEPSDFYGWLELIGQLERALATVADPDAPLDGSR